MSLGQLEFEFTMRSPEKGKGVQTPLENHAIIGLPAKRHIDQIDLFQLIVTLLFGGSTYLRDDTLVLL